MLSGTQFAALHETKPSRTEVLELLETAKAENNTDVVYRLSAVLNKFPDAQTFDWENKTYPTNGLNGVSETVNYTEALDEFGNLNHGYKFENGCVVLNKFTSLGKPKASPITKEATFLKEYNDIKSKYKNEVVLLRNDNFYIAIGDDAKIIHIVLGVEKRTINKNVISGFVASQVEAAKEELVKAGYKVILADEIVEVSKNKLYNKFKEAGAKAKADKLPIKEKTEIVKHKKSEEKSDTEVFSLPVANINVDESRFQNRLQLNEIILHKIADNYSTTKLDPVIVWIDKNKKIYLLAGHHRLEATKRVGKKTIAVKYFVGSEAEAIKYAKVESNTNRSMELPQERAFIYREMIQDNFSKKDIVDEAKKNEGKNANYILNLSYLTPNGIVIEALNKFVYVSDKQNQLIIEKIADWIGEAMRNNDVLTSAHEKEMFVFLNDKEASKRINTKAEFLQKISAITNGMYFDSRDVLNLNRFKNETQGEQIYNAEYKKLQSELDNVLSKKADINDRIKNPKNPNYVAPTSKEFDTVMKVYDSTIAKLNNQIKHFQGKIIELTRSKGTYTNAGSNQVGLFGVKKKRKPKLNGIATTIATSVAAGVTTSLIVNKVINRPKKINAPVIPVQNAPTNSLAHRMANKNNVIHEYYKIPNPEIAEFLGNIEKKKKDSVVITIAGGQGSMKTRLCFQLMNCFAQNYKVGHASIEEHPESALYEDKIVQYLDATALNNITAPEIETIDDVFKLVRENDVIIIDSFSKLQEMQRGIGLDKDFRKAFDGKLFIIIYQLTTDGKMRGGSSSQFDGDIISFIEKNGNYEENYCYHDKNRYNKKNLEDLKFNIFQGKLIKPKEELQPVAQSNFSFQIQ